MRARVKGVDPTRVSVAVTPDHATDAAGLGGRYGPDPGPITDKVADLKEHGFYVKLSDFISLDRNVTSNRHRECRALPTDDYDTLPQTSVIFVFYNEAMSTLLRSIHSVLNRSPPELLKEIILIDDGSDKPHLGDPLEDYIQHLPKVRLVRQPKRRGLVLARLKGAEVCCLLQSLGDPNCHPSPAFVHLTLTRRDFAGGDSRDLHCAGLAH